MPQLRDLPMSPCRSMAPHAPHGWRDTRGTRQTFRCPGAQGLAPDATIRLRPDAFTPEALHSYGWANPRQAALACGVAPSTMRRAIAGEIAPGERLMAALMASTGRTFDSLFVVVTDSRLAPALPGT